MPSSYTLGEHYEKFIRELVQSGRYASASEVVRDAMRLLEDAEILRKARTEELRAEIAKGLAGPFKPLDMEEIIAAAKRQKRSRDAA